MTSYNVLSDRYEDSNDEQAPGDCACPACGHIWFHEPDDYDCPVCGHE